MFCVDIISAFIYFRRLIFCVVSPFVLPFVMYTCACVPRFVPAAVLQSLRERSAYCLNILKNVDCTKLYFSSTRIVLFMSLFLGAIFVASFM